jgi:3-oxoacyl-[acyl-carrier protein] reductase
LKGKKILLIGASGGIGNQLAWDLLTEGAKVALHCKSGRERLGEFKTGSEIYEADITSEEEVEQLIKRVKNDLGGIDILINNAGLSKNSLVWKHSIDDWNEVISVNLTGPFLCTKHVLPVMRENKWGRIIYISSVVPQIGVAGTASYSASKAGLTGLCRTVARENINYNITANVISLGYFNAGLLFQIPEELRDKIKDSIPLKKFGDPSEVSECIKYICSEKSSYLTGQSINLNGGLY